MQSSQDTQKIIAASAGAVVTGIAISTFVTVLEKMLGDSYSLSDQGKLGELCHLYKKFLKLDAPLNWILDDHNRPVYGFVAHRQYEKHVTQAKENKNGIKNYNYYSWLLVESIVQYLEQRKIRLSGKGKKGDLLEQFLGEWLTWALHDLPNLDYDQTSIDKLEARRDYIDAVIKHANLFVYGRVGRDIEKFDIFNILQKELNTCIKKAKEEQTRISSQKHFEVCQQNTAGILLECLKVIYYFRGEAAYKFPLFIDDYSKLNQDEKLSNIAKVLYSKIRDTHTGEMLYATIVQAGVDTFDLITKADSDILISEYFDQEHRIKPVKWDIKRSDLPEWIKNNIDKEDILAAIQRLCESILRLSAIKKLIVAAYALTSGVGDSWAYGDPKGKQAIKSLLFVFDSELDKLKDLFVDFYEQQSSAVNRFNHNEKKNADTQSNLNFSKVSAAIKEIKKASQLLKQTSNEIKLQIDKYPQDYESRIDGLKNYFYSSLNIFIKTYYPTKPDLFSHTVEAEEKSSSYYSFRWQHQLETEREFRLYELDNYVYHLRENTTGQIICTNSNSTQTIFSQKKFNRKAYKAEWNVGESYDDWQSGFFNRNKKLIAMYNTLLEEGLPNAIRSKNIIKIQTIEAKILSCVQVIQDKIVNEKPMWRLSPLTLGWPFNLSARLFAINVIKDSLLKKTMVSTYIDMTVKYINHNFPSEVKEECKNTEEITPNIANDLVLQVNETQRRVSSITTSVPSQAIITQLLNTNPAVASLEEPINGSDKKENQFMKWYKPFNSLFNKWHDEEFKYDLIAIASAEQAQSILEDCLSYHANLQGKDKVFLTNCRDIHNSLNLVLEYSSESISSNSYNQVELVMRLLEVLLASEDKELKLAQFQISIKQTFSVASESKELQAEVSSNNNPRK